MMRRKGRGIGKGFGPERHKGNWRHLRLAGETVFYKQRQGSGVAVEKILFADGANLAVAKETGQTHWTKALLNRLGVVIGSTKQAAPAAVAAAEAPAINRRALQPVFGASEQFVHVLGSGGGG